jgi:hypothetical protein
MNLYTDTIMSIPTGIRVVGMEEDMKFMAVVTPMVTPMTENTSLIKNMGRACTRGSFVDESTMECLVKTRYMEWYVLK